MPANGRWGLISAFQGLSYESLIISTPLLQTFPVTMQT